MIPTLDGSFIDIASVMAALAAVAIRIIRLRRAGSRVTTAPLIEDGLNAASLVPFVALIGNVASSNVIDAIKSASRGSFALAGLIGAIWVMAELLKKP